MTIASDRSSRLDDAAAVFVDPTAYADPARFHDATSLLRSESPVHRVTDERFPEFLAITRYADVFEIAKNHRQFRNRPLAVLQRHEELELQRRNIALETLIHIDDPRHRELRGVTADWFTPRSLRQLDARLAELARRAVDRMVELGGRCDFARDIAMPLPLQVILSILGLPESDYARMLTLTQELFGAADPEQSRELTPEAVQDVLADFFAYFNGLIEDRQANPTDDLASVIANAAVDGEPLTLLERLSYYVIVATAGHDTTSASIAGGIQALVEHPDELQRLQDDPALIPTAVDEIIRWVSPVKHFLRNAVEPVEVNGHRFDTGVTVLLSYWSANFDEDVFDDPHRFDVGRTPNRHLAFGFGAHYCLGAMLARMELNAFLTELLPRLRSIELDGAPALTQAIFVSGLKHLPIRYDVAPAT